MVTLKGRTLDVGKFNCSIKEGASEVSIGGKRATGTIAFSPIICTVSNVGEHKYTLSEKLWKAPTDGTRNRQIEEVESESQDRRKIMMMLLSMMRRNFERNMRCRWNNYDTFTGRLSLQKPNEASLPRIPEPEGLDILGYPTLWQKTSLNGTVACEKRKKQSP